MLSGGSLLGAGFSWPPPLYAKSRIMPTWPTAPDLRNFIALTWCGPMRAVRYLAGSWPRMNGACARRIPAAVDLRKARRFMVSLFAKIDRNDITARVSAIDQTVRQNGGGPGFAAENLRARSRLERFG